MYCEVACGWLTQMFQILKGFLDKDHVSDNEIIDLHEPQRCT